MNTSRKLLISAVLGITLSSVAMAGGKPDVRTNQDLKSKTEWSKKGETEAISSASPSPSVWDTASQGATVEVNGKIRRVGNEPFSVLVITDSADKDWYTDEEGALLLRSFEQKKVTVQAKVELKEMTLANGKIMGTRRILTNMKIITK